MWLICCGSGLNLNWPKWIFFKVSLPAFNSSTIKLNFSQIRINITSKCLAQPPYLCLCLRVLWKILFSLNPLLSMPHPLHKFSLLYVVAVSLLSASVTLLPLATPVVDPIFHSKKKVKRNFFYPLLHATLCCNQYVVFFRVFHLVTPPSPPPKNN